MDGEPKETQGINWKDVETLMKKLGEDLPEEEAEEMIVQADKKSTGQLGPPAGDHGISGIFQRGARILHYRVKNC